MARGEETEWPTLALGVVCYSVWAGTTAAAGAGWLAPGIAVPVLALTIALHSSIQHEVLHGHPFADGRLNEALVFPALGLAIPFRRFRETHLAHHRNELLTDPYDDPESHYLDPAVWRRLPRWRRELLLANNTLIGRLLIGPALGMAAFLAGELRLLRRGSGPCRTAWAMHLLGLMPVIGWLAWVGMPAWAYLAAAYLGLSLLKIRTFLEHRADPDPAGRSVIVEDRGPLALLFLNNNLHAVHHAHPSVAWYRLPALYRARREQFLRRNGGYRYDSYAAVFRTHLLRPKDPVSHPLMEE